ncbi:ABC transporter permease [Lagierella sp. ICN-221743]
MDRDVYSLQLKVYFRKYMRVFFNSKGLLKILSTFIITAIVLSATSEQAFERYDETRMAAFAIVCACIWTGLFNSIELICSERNSIKQEHKSGNVEYSVFLFAHMMVEFILCFVEAIIISAMILFVYSEKFTVDNKLDIARVMSLGFSILLIIYASDMLGLMISSIVKNNKMAMTIMPFALIIQLVLSDFIFQLEGWKIYLSNFTIAKWGLRALGISIKFNTMETALPDAEAKKLDFQAKETIERFLGLTRQKYKNDYKPNLKNILIVFLVLIIFIVIQALISKLALERIDKDER